MIPPGLLKNTTKPSNVIYLKDQKLKSWKIHSQSGTLRNSTYVSHYICILSIRQWIFWHSVIQIWPRKSTRIVCFGWLAYSAAIIRKIFIGFSSKISKMWKLVSRKWDMIFIFYSNFDEPSSTPVRVQLFRINHPKSLVIQSYWKKV